MTKPTGKPVGRPRKNPNGTAKDIAREERLRNIAFFDTETNPFSEVHDTVIQPYFAVLFVSEDSPYNAEIHEEDLMKFKVRVLGAFEDLPGKWTIYAHNGGRFDWLLLLHLIEGRLSFRGNGIMKARIGRHEIRDSYHVMPGALSKYKKDDFDYTKLETARKRKKYAKEILDYCKRDCTYGMDIVREFLGRFGFRDTVGQASMTEFKKFHKVERITPAVDEGVRKYYFGGRVECISGGGEFHGPLFHIDVNSMYPHVMHEYHHPIGNYIFWNIADFAPARVPDFIWNSAYFIRLRCTNYGALMAFGDDGLTSRVPEGEFFTTIHEYRVARKHGLISNVEILGGVSCENISTFSEFVSHFYPERQALKLQIKAAEASGIDARKLKLHNDFTKLVLNSCYGKFAQNPANFREYYITPLDEPPPSGEININYIREFRGNPEWQFPENPTPNDIYWQRKESWMCMDHRIPEINKTLWQRPLLTKRYNNVGTSASITGAARAVLLDAICRVEDPIYCDTDSLFCRGLGDLAMGDDELGVWELEGMVKRMIVAGKKSYGAWYEDGKFKCAAKGINGPKEEDYEQLLRGWSIKKRKKAPTISKTGQQRYITREWRDTADEPNIRLLERLKHGNRPEH